MPRQTGPRQHGVLRRAQLVAAGLDPRAITRRVADGRLHRVHRGVYALGRRGLSREGRWLAAVFAAGEGAALSHLCAAAPWGSGRRGPTSSPSSRPSTASQAGRCVHECRNLDPRDVTSRRAIPVTTVARTCVDLARVVTPWQLANVIHAADFQGRFSSAATRDAIARANGRHNLAVLERALELNAAGSAGTKSPREDAFLALAGAPEPLVNTIVLGEEVDFLWPDLRLNVEVDGSHHRRSRTRRDDARRDAKLRAAGYTVLRFTGFEVNQRPQQVRATLEAARRRLGG